MCNLLIRAAFWVLRIDVPTAIKTCERNYQLNYSKNQGKKYDQMKHLQRQQFSFKKKSIESKVFLKILSHV